MTLYEEDLAYIQAAGFGSFATDAIKGLIPRLRALGVCRVVDVGCGAGVTTRSLVDAGFETTAIEPSSALLAIARVAAPDADFRHASVYETSLPPSGAILALGEPLTYHAPGVDADTRLQRFFHEARGALHGGGLLVFDLITSGGTSLDARGWASGADWAILHESREDRAASRLTRAIETFRRTPEGGYRRGRETHDVRLFDPDEIRAWLDSAGFEVETATAYGAFPLPPRRMAFIATRRDQ